WPAAPAADGGWTRRPGSPLSAASSADFQYVSTGSLLRAVRTPADPGLGSRQPPGARRPFPARAYPAWTSVRHVCAAPDKPPVRGGLFTPIEMSPRPSPHEPSRAAILARQRVAAELGTRAHEARMAQHLTLDQLAGRAGLTRASVHGVEAGRTASLVTYARIATALSL